MRMHGHGAHDDMSYVPAGMLEEWARRDPIDRYCARLTGELGWSEDEVEAIRDEIARYVAECAERALASPMPDPATATEGVFAEAFEPLGDGEAPWSRWKRDRQAGNGAAPATASRAA
jgi:pyruvate dehydrogenase E1 component alpha subunit